jgi:hypothetical protein
VKINGCCCNLRFAFAAIWATCTNRTVQSNLTSLPSPPRRLRRRTPLHCRKLSRTLRAAATCAHCSSWVCTVQPCTGRCHVFWSASGSLFSLRHTLYYMRKSKCVWSILYRVSCVSLWGVQSVDTLLRTSASRERSGVPLPGEGLSCSHLCALWYLLSATRDGRDAGSTTPRRYVVWRGLTFL